VKKLTILVDIDSTICDSLPRWLEVIAEKTGVKAQVSDITEWGMHNCSPLNRVDPKLIYGILNEPGFNRDLKPMAGAVEALKALMEEGHKVYFVTARYGPVGMPETLEWFARHLPFVDPKAQLVFMADKELLEADVLIDDRAETLERYWGAHPYSRLIAIEYAYNARLKESAQYRTVPYGPGAWKKILKLATSAVPDYGPYTDTDLAELG
jgi:5'(3')-deoxyribonucleotidase